MSLYKYNGNNYKKLAQFEAAMSVDLSFRPKFFDNLLSLHEDFDINYRIPGNDFIKSERPDMIGSTLLNMMIEMLQGDIFQILLNHGADLTNVNHNGQTVIHEAVGCNYRKQISSLQSRRLKDVNGYADILLSVHVNRDISKNPCNHYGISHFHIACVVNHKEAVEYFLKNEVEVNEAVHKDSPEVAGFTALHFAAMYASYEAAEILLNYGADVNQKDARGMSALHVLVEERLRIFPAVYRTDNDIDWYDKESVNHYFDKNEKIMKLFLKNIGYNMDDIRLSDLHVTCTLRDPSAVKQLLSKCNVNINLQIDSDSINRQGYTALHFAAAFCDDETFTFLLEKGANMEINDVHGICPFDLCLSSFKVSSIYSILSHHPTWKTIVFSDGRTKLLDFIRSMQTSQEFHSFLSENVENINMFVPLDSPICAGYTPLHLSVICSEKPPYYNGPENDGYPSGYSTFDLFPYRHKKTSLYGTRIKECLDMGANISTQDTRGSSPLHWAFRLQETSLIKLLLDHHKQFDNPTNHDGLSHLHIASASGNEQLVMKLLLNNREDLNSRSKINYYDDSRLVIKSGSTPLHFAVVARSLKVTEILLECGADVLAVDHDNFNPLERVLGYRLAVDTLCYYQEPYDEVKRAILVMLIGRLSRALVNSANASEILLCCYKLILRDTLMLVLRSEDKLRDEILSKVGLTKLHVACITNDINAVRELLQVDGMDIDAQVDEISPRWSGMTPLCCYIDGRSLREDDTEDFCIAEMLLRRGADVMRVCVIRSGSSVVHEAFQTHCYRQMPWDVEVPNKDCRNDLKLVKLLLSYQRDFSVNPTATSGLSHFHIACACNNHEMAMEFLKNGADVNQKIDYFCKEYGGDTPLHIAAIYNSNETVNVLLNHGADVHSTNSYNGTPLHVCAKTRGESLYTMKALLRAGADINAESIIGATPVELLIDYRNTTMDKIDICLKNGFRVDVINPVTGQGCLGQALDEERKSEIVLYKTFVESTDMTGLDRRNRNAIHNVVSVERPSVNDIDNHVIVVDEAFIPAADYTKAIEELIKLNLNIDQQDNRGETPLHYATRMQNVTAILGLLNNGADINISDESGKTAFAYCVKYGDQPFNNDYEDVDTRILQIFTSHAYKLASLDLDVDDSIKKLLQQQLQEERKIVRSTAKKCCKELEKLHVERIKSCSVALDAFLSETNAIVNLSKIPLDERHAVEEFFDKKSEYLCENYPEFAGILMLQHRKALKRINIIPLAFDSLSTLVGFKIPYVCLDIILQFLSNYHLKNLIEAAC